MLAIHTRGPRSARSLFDSLVSRIAEEIEPSEPTLHAAAPATLLDFTLRTWPGYQPARLHQFLAAKLDEFLLACERRESPRLLLTVPPRSGKSELASVRLPAFALGRNPDWPIIHASYGADLSNDFSRRVRNLLREETYQECFPGVLPASDSSAVQRWGIQGRRGVFVSSGVGGSLTGRGSQLCIIDDPVKNDRDADSELFRARQREWYASTLRTRLEDGAGIVMIMTRWHVEDLGGYVTTGAGTDESPGESWEIVNLPAIAGENDPLGRLPGEALWPEKYDLPALEAMRRLMPPRWWEALMQGSPVAAEGNLLEVRKIGHAIPPEGLRVYQAWDLAISSKAGADYTVGATIGIDADQNVYLLDIVRERLSFNATMLQMAEQAAIWKPVSIGIETAGYQAAAFQEAIRRYVLPFGEVHADRDKQTRAQLLASRIACGKVFANRTAPWWRGFESEALAFPQGVHDDQVDAVVYALQAAASGSWWQDQELQAWLLARKGPVPAGEKQPVEAASLPGWAGGGTP